MQQIINSLYQGDDLSLTTSEQLFTEMLSGNLDQIQITGILIALKMKGESSSEIAGLVKAMRSKAKPFGTPIRAKYADCCGTGGDGLNTFNVSTASAFVAAQCGLDIVKHGNRSVSSPYGSADIIEALGIDLHSTAENTINCLNSTQFSFLFAPDYHPLMSHVVPVRKTLATPTIFNLAGPLANPASPPIQLMGVCRAELCKPLAEVLLKVGCERALVVYGSGLDEVALHADTKAVLVDDGKISSINITPELAGLTRQPLEKIQLQEQDDPLAVFLTVIEGKGSQAMTDMLALNAGTLLWLSEVSSDLKDGVKLAKEAILDGQVGQKLLEVQEFYRD